MLMAWAHAAAGGTGNAFELLRQAATIDDRTIGQAFSIGSEIQRMAYAADIWSRGAYLLSLLPHLADGRAAANVGLDLILRRKGLVAESVILQRTAILGGAYPALVPSLKELDGLRTRIAAATLGRERARRDVDAQQVTAWIDRVESLESALARQIPEMTLQQRMRVADRASVAAALPREAVLVEFVRVSPFDFHAVVARGERQWRPARYVAFVLAGDAPDAVQRFDLGEADAIDAKVGAFRESITGAAEPVVPVPERASPTEGAAETRGAIRDATRHLGAARKPKGTSQDAHAQGEALRAVVLDPLLPALGGRTRLVLAPDGDLARVPFEVLPLSATSRMIDVYKISYVTTGRDVLRFGAATGSRVARAVVAGDPSFDLGTSPDQASGSPFGRLAGTGAEGMQVAAMLGVKPLLADAVLETPLKAGRGPAILHLATHGFFLPDLPRDANLPGDGMTSAMGPLTARPVANPLLRSGLALAGANTWLAGSDPPAEAEDGLLMAEDVAGMDLLDTELVVLSACDTGLGDIRAGEGVFGLRRAFALAGARTLVMSLWKVRDHETQELMADFYGRILKGEPRAQALRAAQLAMKTRHPDPLYWGAFICQGEPGPLPAPLCA
jgi:CHAT domain-containing protein